VRHSLSTFGTEFKLFRISVLFSATFQTSTAELACLFFDSDSDDDDDEDSNNIMHLLKNWYNYFAFNYHEYKQHH
jgi:hypothetical protein